MLAGAGAALSAALAGCSGLTPFVGKREESTRTVPVEDASAVAAVVDVGDVTVRSAERDDVRVEFVKQSSSVGADLSKLEFRVERDDDRLVLRGDWTGDGGLWGTPSLDLDVVVPASLSVERVASSVGDLTVENARGDVSIDGQTSDVTVRSHDGSVDVESQTGDVNVRSLDGSVDVDTQTGDVVVRDPSTLAGATTQTGDVDVDVPAIDGDTTIRSQTGDVTAAIAADVDAELRATTEAGDVDVRDLELSDALVDETAASGTLGDGGPTLRVECQTGDVVLERQN